MALSLTGQVVRKQCFGDWAVGTFRTRDGDTLKVVGMPVIGLQDGQEYELSGELKTHPKYGEQLDVRAAVPFIEPDRGALLKHLERNFLGVGPKTALHIVEWHEANASLEALREKLVHRPWELQTFVTSGTGKAIQFKHAATTSFQYLYTLLATRHAGSGVTDSSLRRFAKWLAEECKEESDPIGTAIARFHADPYRPILHVWGYGFTQADAIAGQLGMPRAAPCRLAALAYHTLKSAAEGEGHTFLPKRVFEQRLLRADSSVSFSDAVRHAADFRYPVTEEPGGRFYPDGLAAVEASVSDMLRALLLPAPAMRAFANEELLLDEVRGCEKTVKDGFELDTSQRRAVVGLLRSCVRLHSVTAGPGRGKTALMEVFAQLVLGSVKFCAPTGKAAKVLHGRVARHGFSATTIHQLLEPTPFGFTRNADNPIEADVVVVDESSMADLMLGWHLLQALAPGAHLVLVGDRDQLPSVGPGNLLAGILELPADHHTLDVTHRNQGDILALVQMVRDGNFRSPGTDFAGDVLHMPVADDNPATFQLVLETYLDAVRRVGVHNTGLLVARRRGRREEAGWNTTYLNARLQGVLNPDGTPLRGTHLRVNDRVIVRRNMMVPQGTGVVSVVNGDTGEILSVQWREDGTVKTCALRLDDGRALEFPGELLDFLGLAYAMTVHAAQGSEYRIAIVVMTPGARSFMHRRVLYTAVSRAREQLVLFGDHQILAEIASRTGGARYSALVQRTLAQ